jgi:hypothetical protein
MLGDMATLRATALKRPSRDGVARVSDVALDFGVLAFAAWTLIYHACLYLHIRSVWAAVAEALLLIPCALVAGRRQERPDAAPATAAVRSRSATPRRIALAVNVLAALAAAIVFGWVRGNWSIIWPLWLISAVAGLALTYLPRADAPETEPGGGRGAVAALAWGLGLAVLSLFVVRPDSDDTQYVHLSAWIAEHGSFPLRDTLFTDEKLPALFYPPVSSWEAMLGTLARGIPISLPDLVYLVVVPVASFVSVLALWRLLRSWRVPLVGLALSVAVLFLLFDARGHWMPGSYFIGRNWQGKVLFLTILVPLVFVLLQDQVERPTRRGLLLLGAVGIAGVGLTTSAIFLLPILGFACLAPIAVRRRRQAIAAFAAVAAYPLLIGLATLAVGGRNPDDYTSTELTPLYLLHHTFGIQQFAAACLLGALVAALGIPRRTEARMVASVALVVGLLFTPGVPQLIFDATGLGRVLWRLTWVLPIAAGIGAVAVTPLARARSVPLRAVGPVLVGALIVLFGTPLWSFAAQGTLASHPAWKLWDDDVQEADAILRHASPKATVLAPQKTSQTLLILSGTIRTVDPLDRYVSNLSQFRKPEYKGRYHPRVRERLVLDRFVQAGLGGLYSRKDPARYVAKALRRVGVDVVCLLPARYTSEALLRKLGWTRFGGVPTLRCWRKP